MTRFERLCMQKFDANEKPEELPPRITMHPETWCDALTMVKMCPIEVSWYSKIEETSPNTYHIFGMIVPQQDCAWDHTTSIGGQLQQALDEQIADIESSDQSVLYHCWGHSHVNGDAYMSDTDYALIEQFMDLLLIGHNEEVIGPWISLVANKRGEIRAWVDFAKPRHGWGGLAIALDPDVSNGTLERMVADFSRRERIRSLLRERVSYMGRQLP